MTDISENENYNKKLTQNDAGSSRNKSYNKHKIHSLNEYVKNMVEKLRAIPKHLNIDKKKRWTFNLKYKNLPMKHLIQKTKRHKKTNAKICVYAAKKIFGIRKKKISLILECGKNVTIAKDIMNCV